LLESPDIQNTTTKVVNLGGIRNIKRNSFKEGSRFCCEHCGRMFAHEASYNAHLKTHTGEKPFQCTQCGRGFADLSNMKRHLSSHTSQKNYTCNHCFKRFRLKASLIPHYRVHTGERPYPCLNCSKRFTEKTNLLAHLRIHTSLKPFVCTRCGRRFAVRCNLQLHEAKHNLSSSKTNCTRPKQLRHSRKRGSYNRSSYNRSSYRRSRAFPQAPRTNVQGPQRENESTPVDPLIFPTRTRKRHAAKMQVTRQRSMCELGRNATSRIKRRRRRRRRTGGKKHRAVNESVSRIFTADS